MKRKLIAIFAFSAFIISAFQSVHGQPRVPDEFVTVFGDITPEFDPHFSIYSNEAQIFTALYEGLFSYDPSTLDPIPGVVDSWTKSKDGKVYTFILKENLKWSDGSLLKAQDFADSWLRILKKDAQYATFFDIIEGASAYRTKQNLDPSAVGILASDLRTLEVRLNRPVAYFTRLLCHHSFAPIHPSMRDAEDWASEIPYPVNGPYRFSGYANGRLSLKKNQYYWDKDAVSIEKLGFIFTDDDAAATLLFNSEEAHWLAGPGDYDLINLDQAIQVNPIFSTHYWYFDASKTPWDKAQVRRALALLLPWQELRDSTRYMIPATTLVLPLPGYSGAKGIEKSDKIEALALLEDSGYPKGHGLPPIDIHFADGKDSRRVAGIMEKAWEAELRIEVNLVPVSAGKYYNSIGRGKKSSSLVLAHTTWIGDFADPEAFLQMWTPDSSLNDSGFKDPEFTRLLETSYLKEGKERYALLAEAENVLLATAAVLPLYHSFAASAIDIDYIDGWYQNALDIHPYKYLAFGTPSVMPNVARLGIFLAESAR
ncbi:MAG: ABC transporter substrate-binding protein [Spirochaetes bacterium]|nr:MAG: ABC transporter substrate-binding protein [Spirochaetota bacterium]